MPLLRGTFQKPLASKAAASNSSSGRASISLKAVSPLQIQQNSNALSFSSPFLKPVTQRVVVDKEGKKIPWEDFKKIALEYNIRNEEILTNVYTTEKSLSLYQAVNLAVKSQKEEDYRDMAKKYKYDSEDLSDEDLKEDKKVTFKRTKDEKEGFLMDTPKAMKWVAREKRRMLYNNKIKKSNKTAKEKKEFKNIDTTPILVDIAGTGMYYELQPNKMKKDLGVYKVKKENDSYIRLGNAKTYEKLGKEIDKAVEELKITYDKANRIILECLAGNMDILKGLDNKYASLFGELLVVLMSDMARGSKAHMLIKEMLYDNSSFTERLKQGGNYEPATTGGTKVIREHTDQNKNKKF